MNWTLQFGLFVIAGLATTLVDFAFYNLLTGRRFKLARIPANFLSVSVAMAFSYLVNLILVFRPAVGDGVTRGVRFLAVTLVSAYLLQNLVIYLTSDVWVTPTERVQQICKKLYPGVAESFVRRNAVKVFATSAGLLWNFLWYKFYVYN